LRSPFLLIRGFGALHSAAGAAEQVPCHTPTTTQTAAFSTPRASNPPPATHRLRQVCAVARRSAPTTGRKSSPLRCEHELRSGNVNIYAVARAAERGLGIALVPVPVSAGCDQVSARPNTSSERLFTSTLAPRLCVERGASSRVVSSRSCQRSPLLLGSLNDTGS